MLYVNGLVMTVHLELTYGCAAKPHIDNSIAFIYFSSFRIRTLITYGVSSFSMF